MSAHFSKTEKVKKKKKKEKRKENVLFKEHEFYDAKTFENIEYQNKS